MLGSHTIPYVTVVALSKAATDLNLKFLSNQEDLDSFTLACNVAECFLTDPVGPTAFLYCI